MKIFLAASFVLAMITANDPRARFIAQYKPSTRQPGARSKEKYPVPDLAQ